MANLQAKEQELFKNIQELTDILNTMQTEAQSEGAPSNTVNFEELKKSVQPYKKQWSNRSS